jgi:hypothetical protein
MPISWKKPALILAIACLAMRSPSAQAMDPKLKALGMVAMYGTIGGALLGTASLAFGTKPRAIFQGASLGLYAGLIFGTYIVVTHSSKGDPDDRNRRDGSEHDGREDGEYTDDAAQSENSFRYEGFSYFDQDTPRWNMGGEGKKGPVFNFQLLALNF